MSAHGSLGYRTSRQAQLQRALGELGRVLPRVQRGEGPFMAAGWYAEVKGSMRFLGDNSGVAFVEIARLRAELNE